MIINVDKVEINQHLKVINAKNGSFDVSELGVNASTSLENVGKAFYYYARDKKYAKVEMNWEINDNSQAGRDTKSNCYTNKNGVLNFVYENGTVVYTFNTNSGYCYRGSTNDSTLIGTSFHEIIDHNIFARHWSGSAYKGDYVLYNNNLYHCLADTTTAPTNTTYWELINYVCDELTSIREEMSNNDCLTASSIATSSFSSLTAQGSKLKSGIGIVNVRINGSGSVSIAGTGGILATITDSRFKPIQPQYMFGTFVESDGSIRHGEFRINTNGTINQIVTSRTFTCTSFSLFGTYIV